MGRHLVLIIAWIMASVLVGLVLGWVLYRRRIELERRTAELQEHASDAWSLRGVSRHNRPARSSGGEGAQGPADVGSRTTSERVGPED